MTDKYLNEKYMKTIIKLSGILLIIISALLSCTKEVSEIEVKEVNLNTLSCELYEGETFQLIATVLPENATDKSVKWSSSNEKIASVENGLVICHSVGSVSISATAGSKTISCKINVLPKVIEVESIELDKTSIELRAGESYSLVATIHPDDASEKTIIWSSSDESVVTVKDGKVSALAIGNSIIKACAGSKHAECIVTVVETEVESISLNKTSIDLIVGDIETLIATVKPDDATNKTVIWDTSDETVVLVNNGEVKAVGSGTAKVLASAGNKRAECIINVSAIEVESITLSKNIVNLKVGYSETLIASIMPDNATDKSVFWASSNETVAMVTDGVIKAIGVGSTIIVASAGDQKAECVVNVSAIEVESISLNITSLDLKIGESRTLVASIEPDDATDKTVLWTSSDETVVIVTDGNIKAIGVGSAVINATSGKASADCVVNVTEPNGIIYYTSTNNMVVEPYDVDAFGSAIISNTYENGVGTITFAGLVKKIGESAFYKTNIKTIVLPDGISSIDSQAFCSCHSLENIELPSSVTSIGDYAFYHCYSSNFTYIDIPSSVVSIGNYAFGSCSNLCVSFNEGLETIGEWAFSGCKVDEVILPNTLKTIGKYAFENCDVKTLTIGDGVSSIPLMAFYNCNLLRTVSYGKNLTVLEESVFENCRVLNNVVLPEGLLKIGNECFRMCPSLENISLPSSLQEIGEWAFYNDSRNNRLASITIPGSVTKIGGQAFSGCSNLKTVIFEEGITEISSHAFQSCGVETIQFPESLTSIGSGAFNACYSLKEIILPANVTAVNESAFLSCTGVENIVLNDKLSFIGSSAFKGCDPKEAVIIPENVTEIGSSAFDFYKVASYYLRPLTPPICKYDSFGTNYSKTIYVPNESLEEYKTASGWNQLLKYLVGYDVN